MPRLQGRLDKLERTLDLSTGRLEHFRIVADGVGPLNLATSTCTRTLRRGSLMEIVKLDGCIDELSEEQLETFIETFPIQREDAAR
jgi:hypothetical protein